jgi:hypothetical protein
MPFTYTPVPVPLARPAVAVGVFRHFPDTGKPYWFLPNIRCLAVQYREGPEPPVARFRYAFDELAADGRPLRFEQVFPLDAVGDYIIQNDDRLAVLYFTPDGGWGIVFDGFASVPQADVAPDGQQVTFVAFGVPVREWDTPVVGAVYRESDRPTVATANITTDLPVRFNSEGLANASPDGADSGEDPRQYPVFIDPNTVSTVGEDVLRYWTLDMAVRYLVNTGHSFPLVWTEWPDLDAWTPWLQAWQPSEGDNFDPGDPSTYDKEDIRVSDVDVSGEPWPAAMHKLVEPHNIGMCWRVGFKSGKAAHYLDLFRKDAPVGVKAVKMQAAGAALDPAATNVGAVNLARDVAGLATEIEVLTGPTRYEVSVVLTPEFAIAAGDLTNPTQWVKNNSNLNPTKYRRFVYGEDGRSRWSFTSGALVTNYQGLAPILADPGLAEKQESQYVHRPRPGLNTLITVDSAGNPLKAELWVSTDYAGLAPRIWDKADASHWQKVGGNWKLLDDCLGVELTMPDPEDLNIGKSDDATAPFAKHGKVNLVTSLAAPTAAMPRVYFRLTCVIEADRGIDAVAPNRFVGPTTYSIRRTVDCRDRLRKDVVHKSSHLNTTGDDVIRRDDTAAATALAYAQQRASELARLGGSVTIPRFTLAYRVGDKIRSIDGRDLSLVSNVGEDQGEGPTYPTVVAVDYEFDGGQRTVIHMSDERSRPERPRRVPGRGR